MHAVRHTVTSQSPRMRWGGISDIPTEQGVERRQRRLRRTPSGGLGAVMISPGRMVALDACIEVMRRNTMCGCVRSRWSAHECMSTSMSVRRMSVRRMCCWGLSDSSVLPAPPASRCTSPSSLNSPSPLPTPPPSLILAGCDLPAPRGAYYNMFLSSSPFDSSFNLFLVF